MGLESGEFPRPLSPNPNNNRGRYDLNVFLDFYQQHGLIPMPLEHNSKKPKGVGWPKASREELLKLFENDDNVGLRIQYPYFIIDVDDRRLASIILDEVPKTWIVETRRGMHIYLRSSNYYPKQVKKSRLIQLLTEGSQVVAPPSIVEGHVYRFVNDPSRISIAEIDEKKSSMIESIIETISKYEQIILGFTDVWIEGHRHNISLWLNGCLRKLGIPLSEAAVIIKSICLLSGDSEIRDRLRSLEDTYKKPIHEIAAWSKLRDELASIVGFDKASSLITILPKKKIEFEVQSLPQVISEAKPIEWLIDGLIPKYGLVLLVGKASTGKSFLALCLAYAIATGREFIGILEPIEKGRVLICDAENYPGLYKQRIEAMGLAPIEDIDMIILSNFAIDKKSHLDRLAELIKERSYKLVIFDAWSNLISRIDENKAAEVSRILSYMRRISYENNCCFLLVHHLRKNLPYTIELKDELRGSSSLTNEADLILLLQQTRFNRILRTIKHRYGEDQAFEIEFRNNGQLEIIGRRIKIEEAEDETSKAAEAIVNYLEIKHSAASRDELINALPYTRATIDRALRFLKNMGRIHAPKRGYYMLPLTIDEVE